MRAFFPSISMIYRDSKLDFDEFKNSAYVTPTVQVLRKRSNDLAEWNWLKQANKTDFIVLKAKASGLLRRLFSSAPLPLLAEQRNGLVVLRLRDRRQISVHVGEVRRRQHFLAVGRHRAIGRTHEGHERIQRHRIRRQH